MARFDPAGSQPTPIIHGHRLKRPARFAEAGVQIVAALLSLAGSGAPTLAAPWQPLPSSSGAEHGISGTVDSPRGVPLTLGQQTSRHLVLSLGKRQLLVVDDGEVVRRFPVAVGMPGWETPSGQFKVLE